MTPTLTGRLAAVAFAVAALLGVARPALATGADPQTIMDEIYGQVSGMCAGDAQGPAYDFEKIAERYFTPELIKTVSKATASGDLDFDVLVDGQDCKVTGLGLTIVGGGDSTAIGRAMFKNFGEDRTIDFPMVKTGGAWFVADIVYRHRPFSLKDAF